MTNTTVHSCVIETRNHMGMDNSKFSIQIRTGTTNHKCFQQFFPCQNGFYKFMRDTLDSHMLLRIMILLFKTLDRRQGQREEGESGSNCPKQPSNNHENYYGNENRVESQCVIELEIDRKTIDYMLVLINKYLGQIPIRL